MIKPKDKHVARRNIMNKWQRGVLLLGVFVVLLMRVFPPTRGPSGGFQGYEPIWSWDSHTDYLRLVLQVVGASIVTCGVMFCVGGKHNWKKILLWGLIVLVAVVLLAGVWYVITRPSAPGGWEIARTIAACGTAVGTVGAVFIVLFGGQIRAWFLGPRLRVQVDECGPGTLVHTFDKDGKDTGWQVSCYLRVVNKPAWWGGRRDMARNCMALLRRVQEQNSEGEWEEVKLPVPLQFKWCLRRPERVDLSEQDAFDLFAIQEIPAHEAFLAVPTFCRVPNNFQGGVKAGVRVRYHVHIVADNYVGRRWEVFEIYWDGAWPKSEDEVAEHITIKPVRT